LEQGFIEMLISLLDDEPENVLTNVAGAIEQIVKTDPKNAYLIKKAGAIPPLIGLLTINNPVIIKVYMDLLLVYSCIQKFSLCRIWKH